jgi:hypothetical protein
MFIFTPSASKSPLASCVQFFFEQTALHILSGCDYNITSGMITERRNIACRLTIKAISKGSFAGCHSKLLSLQSISLSTTIYRLGKATSTDN